MEAAKREKRRKLEATKITGDVNADRVKQLRALSVKVPGTGTGAELEGAQEVCGMGKERRQEIADQACNYVVKLPGYWFGFDNEMLQAKLERGARVNFRRWPRSQAGGSILLFARLLS